MTDRELLELAAKAAGYRTDHPWNEERVKRGLFGLCIDRVSTNWNPLGYDDDALRLAVKLHIDVFTEDFDEHGNGEGTVEAFHPSVYASIIEKIDSDPYAATRRAIVRAAAEIGRMK